MQKLLEKKETLTNLKTDYKSYKNLSKNEIKYFYSKKKNKDFLIGLEYERISLDKNTLKTASYDKISKIIEHFASITSWALIYDNDTIIGAISKDNTSISLEPGCQLEISLAPKKSILDIDIQLTKIVNLLDNIAKIYDVIFLGYGINPQDSVDEIEILNKTRYKIMNDYLPNCPFGELAPKMMRQSAGIQVNIDYKDNFDAYYKLKFFNLIMPFITGLCANSPLEKNKLSDKKSIRAHIWRYTGKERCNLFYKNIFSKLLPSFNLFDNYIDEILDVPMIFIEKNGNSIPIEGDITFREYMKYGYMGFSADIYDYILHQSLIFPDIRLKKYIEIRNHDSSSTKIALALCALYKGLSSINPKKLLKDFKYLKINDIEKYNEIAANKALDFDINSNISAWDVIIAILNQAKQALNSKDRSYLAPIFEMIKTRKTQSDILIDYNIKSTKDLVEFLS